MQDNTVFIFYLSIAVHTQKVITENVMAKLTKGGKQLSVPLETKIATIVKEVFNNSN
jgi:hypothetical protein